MMRHRIVRVVGVFAEPEVWILDPLDMGVGLARRIKMKIRIDMPGKEITRIAPKEIQVGITGCPQKCRGDVLRNPPDLRIEKFGNDMRLPTVRQRHRAVGSFSPLEALADEQPCRYLIGPAGGGEDK